MRILIVHPRMRGSRRVEPAEMMPAAVLCAILELKGGWRLLCNELWRWARDGCRKRTNGRNACRRSKRSELEPLFPGFTREYVHDRLIRRRDQIPAARPTSGGRVASVLTAGKASNRYHSTGEAPHTARSVNLSRTLIDPACRTLGPR